MSKQSTFLSPLERQMIEQSGALDDRQRRNLNYRLKAKVSHIAATLQEIKLLVEKSPPERLQDNSAAILEELLSLSELIVEKGKLEESDLSKAAISSMKLAEITLKLADPWAIGLHESGERRIFRTLGYTIPSIEPGKCTILSVSRSALEEDVILHDRIKEHLDRVRYFVDPCFPDPICRDLDYVNHLGIKVFNFRKEMLEKTGEAPSMELSNYLVDEKQTWRPLTIPVERLRSMRWRPRGLKSCMELPPLFDEKNIPEDPTPNEKAEQK